MGAVRQVFKLDEKDDKLMPCRVGEIKTNLITGMFGDAAKEKALFFIIGYSTKNKRWCGVDMSYLRTEMTKLQAHEIDLVNQGIKNMLMDGSLIHPRSKGFLFFKGKLSMSEVYLSPGLINKILVNQKSVAK